MLARQVSRGESPISTDRFADADRLFAALGLPEADEALRADWAVSQTSFQADEVFFLKPGYLRDACRTLRMSEEVTGALLASLRAFDEQPELRRLAWHLHCLTFPASGDAGLSSRQWPKLPKERMESAAGLFLAVVLLSGLGKIRAYHRERGVSDEISRDTFGDVEVWIRDYRTRNGHWGFVNTGWLSLHFTGRLYKVGRLQFNFNRFGYDFHVLRHARSRRVQVLAGDGMRFRGDGRFDGSNDITDPDHAWDARYESDGSTIRGTPISARRGVALREPITLPAAEWTQILGQSDPTLGVHIDASGPMDYAACGDSFRRAAPFFRDHFPEHPFQAFQCTSWLLDPQFEENLAPSSNIVRVLQEYYLFPYPRAGDHGALDRVFGTMDVDPDTAPQDTSLRRAILRHIKAGRRWCAGGGLIFPEDLDWGAQVYRNHRGPTHPG